MNFTKTLLLASLSTTMMFASSGKELAQKNCASCHMMETPTPDVMPTLKTPAMEAVIFHVNLAISDKKEAKAFIMDYVINPDASKSVCESNKVSKYGVMPSLKGAISTEALSKITDYLLSNFPSPKFVEIITEIQRNDKMNALLNSPFLINNEHLPHLTKMLLHNWDKASLGLSAEQKTKLLLVRKHTMGAIKKLKPVIFALEAEIQEALVDGNDPKTLDTQVDKIAKLKAEVTKVHLKCIFDTINILSEEQLALLLPFWDM